MVIVSETLRNANPKAFYNLAGDSEVGCHVLKVECHKLDVIRKGFSLDNITWEPWSNMVSEFAKDKVRDFHRWYPQKP